MSLVDLFFQKSFKKEAAAKSALASNSVAPAVSTKKAVAYASANDTVSKGSYSIAPQYDNRRHESTVYLEGYKNAPWIKPCVDMIARTGAKNWRLVPVDKTKDTIDPIEIEPIMTFY